MKIEVKIERATGRAILRTGEWADANKTKPVVYAVSGGHQYMDMRYWRYKCKPPEMAVEHMRAATLLVKYANLQLDLARESF